MIPIKQKIKNVLREHQDRRISKGDIAYLIEEDIRNINEPLFELERDEEIIARKNKKGKKVYMHNPY